MSRQFTLLLAAVVVVVAIGLWGQAIADAPRSLLVAQAVVGVIALVVVAGLCVLRPDPRSRSALVACGLALAALAAPRLFPGLDGVHRWFPFGPLQVQPAALALPVIVWFALGRRDSWAGPASLGVAMLLAAAQPDGQAVTGLLAVSIATVLLGQLDLRWGALIGLGTVALTITAFAPVLAPVPWVELVPREAFAAAWLLGVLMLAALIAVALCPMLFSRDRQSPDAIAQTALWFGLGCASLAGTYPVPVIGFGLSWVLGWGLSLGLSRRG